MRFELTNHNTNWNQYHRVSVPFLKDGSPRSQTIASQGGYRDITLDYTFISTRLPELVGQPALYVTNYSARLRDFLVDTGGEETNVTLYWGESDGGLEADQWERVMDLGPHKMGAIHVDLNDLDPAETFTTHAALGSYSGYRVQSGRVRMVGTGFDVDILSVHDMNRAFALFSYGTGGQPDVANANAVLARGYLLDTDTLRFERKSAWNATWVSWQVIECLDREFQVYRGGGTLGSDLLAVDAPLNGAPPQTGGGRSQDRGQARPDVVADPAWCIAQVSADSSASNRLYYHEALLTAYVNTDTTFAALCRRTPGKRAGDGPLRTTIVTKLRLRQTGRRQQRSRRTRGGAGSLGCSQLEPPSRLVF